MSGLEIRTDGVLSALFAKQSDLVEKGWHERVADNPYLFNGAVYLTGDIQLQDGCLTGHAARTDYANFLHWRGNTPFQNAVGLHHIFPAAAIESADGILIAVRASSTTINSGKVYFAGGNFDDDDLVDGRLDPHHNTRREVLEETGLDLCAMSEADGWIAVRSHRFIAVFKPYQSHLAAADLAAMILSHVGKQTAPENDACVLIREARDITSNMPLYMQAYCRYRFKSKPVVPVR